MLKIDNEKVIGDQSYSELTVVLISVFGVPSNAKDKQTYVFEI
jgi:hypothetical protein